LVKVNDKRKAVGQVKVAHIMFKTGLGADEKKLSEAKESRRGNKNLQLTTYDHRGISITTFLGEILIQYTKF
jgi:hypothetical protein